MRHDTANGTGQMLPGIPITEEDLNQSVVARFRRVMGQLPANHLAYVDDQEQCTYHEFDTLSDAVAALIAAEIGCGDGYDGSKPVALLLPHTVMSLIGTFGVLKAGHFYVALDEAQGDGVLQQILQDCTPPLLLTVGALQETAHRIVGENGLTRVLLLDRLTPPHADERVEVFVHALAYVTIQYTSGSTGTPRGIIRTHAQKVKSAYNLYLEADFRPSDHLAHLLSYAHGLSTIVIFGGLLHGGTLYARPMRDVAPTTLHAWLQACQITQLSLTVGLLRMLAELGDTHAPLSTLRMVCTGGDAVNSTAIQRMRKLMPADCKFINRLGTTEGGTITSLVVPPELTWEGERVPAGYPLPLMDVFILDEAGQRVSPPTTGEIAVQSRYLAAGYWKLPALTAAKFLPDPDGGDRPILLTGDMGFFDESGSLNFLGRKDFMVKIRGYRVELEAVDAALLALPYVHEAAVLAQELPSGDKRLVAYVVLRHQPEDEAAVSVARLRSQMAASVPGYMVPSVFVLLPAFARNVAGKIDRKALPLPENQRPALVVPFVAPRTETEAQLCFVWESLLEINPIGVDDDFFELGGDSLLSMRMAAQIEQQWQKDVPPAFFNQPTIAWLAQFLEGTAELETVDSEQIDSVQVEILEPLPEDVEVAHAGKGVGVFSTLGQRIRGMMRQS